jgi:hypothetical protein
MEIAVTGFETLSDVTHFEIKVTKENGMSYTFLSRFSELNDVHLKFKDDNKRKTIPEFPPKKMFGSTSITFIEQRLKGLELYFTNIVKYKDKLQYDLSAWIQFVAKRELSEKNANRNANQVIGQQPQGQSRADIQREGNQPKQSLTGVKTELSYKNKIEALYDQYVNKLVFMDTKYLNANLCKKNNVQVDNLAPNTSAVVLTDEFKDFSKIVESLNGAEGFCAEIDNVIHLSNEAEKKKYLQEFFHLVKLNIS